MIRFKNTFIYLSFLLFASCGYHLRGTIDLPESLKNIYLEGASVELIKEMKNILRSSDGKLVDNIQQAGAIIKINQENMRRRSLSLSSTGRVDEFELYYVLNYALLDVKQNVLSEKQNIEISKDYFNDQTDILGKDKEERVIRGEIYRQAATSIITRARVIFKSSSK